MERLMVARLESSGCAVELQLNGMPVATLGPTGGRQCVAVHEYTLAGRNALTLLVAPGLAADAAPQPRVAVGPTWARGSLVLVRQGQSAADPNARVLASVEWACEEGQAFEAPTRETREVDLPVNFPRWRWLDAPPIEPTPAVRRQVLEFLQQLAVELGRGNPEPMLLAARLRFEELALAYQTTAADAMQRFRDRLQQAYERKALKTVPPVAEDLLLRPLADGRLLECLNTLGAPVLRTQNEDAALGDQAWPIRLAIVDGRIYVLR